MRKKYRDITVDGVKYAWMARGYDFLIIWKDKKVFKQMQVRCTVTPKFVEDVIRETIKVQTAMKTALETQGILKTSEEWMKESGYIVLDPDGWDRSNYEWSFHKEKITKEEFNKRLSKSTAISINIKNT